MSSEWHTLLMDGEPPGLFFRVNLPPSLARNSSSLVFQSLWLGLPVCLLYSTMGFRAYMPVALCYFCYHPSNTFLCLRTYSTLFLGVLRALEVGCRNQGYENKDVV